MNPSVSDCATGLPPAWCAPYLKPGDTYPALQFAFTATLTGAPLNFADGSTARAQIRDKRRNAPLLTFTATVAGNVVTLAPVPSATTLNLPRGRHWFELETREPGGNTTTWIDSAEILIGEDHAHG